MVTTRLQEKKGKAMQAKSIQPMINRLPSEVLAEIFITCTHLCVYESYNNRTPKLSSKYVCQATVSTVCRLWRDVALGTSQLWSLVTLPDPAPWLRSAAYLARSGTVCPLDIDIYMMRKFWDNPTSTTAATWAKQAKQALDFITSHGGVTSRWRSMIVITDSFASLRTVAEFLRASPLPKLRRLELLLDCPSEYDGRDEVTFHSASSTSPVPLFKEPPHNLRVAKLLGFPNPFLFGHSNQLHLPNLTRLELEFIDFPPNLSDIKAMLQTTTQLAALRFDFGWTDSGFGDPHPLQSKVKLSHLQELGLEFIKEGFWPLKFLMMLEAPSLDYFQLGLSECEAGSEEIVQFIADGGNKSDPAPLFPDITRLEANFGVGLESTPRLKTLLLSHPKVTVLEVPWTPLKSLSTKPWLAPNVERLRVAGCRAEELRKVVNARTRAKLPLKVVEVGTAYSHLIKSRDRKYLRSKVELRFVEPGNYGEHEYRIVDEPPTDDELGGFLSRYSFVSDD